MTTTTKGIFDDPTVIYLQSCQFAYGGLFDAVPTDNVLHLVRGTIGGTPGKTLCNAPRFGADAPGFAMGGGVSQAGQVHKFCGSCAAVANADFPGIPVSTSLKADYSEFGLIKGDSNRISRDAVLRAKAAVA